MAIAPKVLTRRFLRRGARLKRARAGAFEKNREQGYEGSSIETEYENVNQYLDASPAPKVYFRSRKEAIRVLP
ncbi:hypothetical protein PY74_08065, partial [Lacticaseibacillus rhamnosus]